MTHSAVTADNSIYYFLTRWRAALGLGDTYCMVGGGTRDAAATAGGRTLPHSAIRRRYNCVGTPNAASNRGSTSEALQIEYAYMLNRKKSA